MTSGRKRYHHGDLKQALIAQSLKRLESGGIEGLSLRKIAADVGVNHTAAYSHFPTKDALIAAMLQSGYDQLAERLTVAVDEEGDRVARLVQVSLVYHAFSREQPNLFFAMIGPRLNADNDFPDLEAALLRAYQFIEAPIREAGDQAALDQASAPAFWASLQGLLAQLLSERIRVVPAEEAALIEQFVRALCDGLGLESA